MCRQRRGYYGGRSGLGGLGACRHRQHGVARALAALPRVILLKKSLKEVGLRGPIWLNHWHSKLKGNPVVSQPARVLLPGGVAHGAATPRRTETDRITVSLPFLTVLLIKLVAILQYVKRTGL